MRGGWGCAVGMARGLRILSEPGLKPKFNLGDKPWHFGTEGTPLTVLGTPLTVLSTPLPGSGRKSL